jgi:branched-chain amino acid transport system permease protein
MSTIDLLQNLLFGIAQGSIYALIAVGFTIIFSATEIVNLAQGEFIMLGAMFTFWFSAPPSIDGSIGGMGLPIYLAVILAVVATLIIGVIMGWVMMRPLKKANSTTMIIITIGASMIIQGIASHVWGKDAVKVQEFTKFNDGAMVIMNVPFLKPIDGVPPQLFLQQQQIWIIGIMLILVILLTLFFNLTMAGKAMRATAMNKVGAKLIGVNVSRTVMLAFGLSAAIGALGGAAIAPIYAQYDMGGLLGLKGFAAAIVGGLGNFPGSVIAGLILGMAEAVGANYASNYKDAISFVILLIVLIISPNGLPALLKKRRK